MYQYTCDFVHVVSIGVVVKLYIVLCGLPAKLGYHAVLFILLDFPLFLNLRLKHI